MDKKIANNVIVGVVVTVGFMGFLFILFNLGGGAGLFARTYPLFVRFHNVKGLHYGSEVSLSGLRVGFVKAITVAKDNPKELVVELAVGKEMQDRIREDSVASLRTQGVLGDKFVEVTLGSPELPVLKAGAALRSEDQEDIFAKGSNLVGDVKRHFEKGGDVEQLLKNVNTLATNLNVLAVNLGALTSDVRKNHGLLNEMIYGESGKKFAGTMASLNEIMRKINEGEGTIGGLITDPTVYEDLKTIMGGAKRSSILRYFMRSFMEGGSQATGPDSGKKKKGE